MCKRTWHLSRFSHRAGQLVLGGFLFHWCNSCSYIRIFSHTNTYTHTDTSLDVRASCNLFFDRRKLCQLRKGKAPFQVPAAETYPRLSLTNSRPVWSSSNPAFRTTQVRPWSLHWRARVLYAKITCVRCPPGRVSGADCSWRLGCLPLKSCNQVQRYRLPSCK